ncbi:MAG TPA: group 1 truncated hemoglobin [Microcella sp.]|nr:group 1 truncated hemoglobin [Microcella sp.]
MGLYERLGGEAGLDRAVRELSDRIKVDPVLGRFFAHLDYDAIVQHRSDYLIAILGGPERYTGQGMREAHRHLALSDEHMDTFLRLVRETLTDCDVSPLDVEAAVGQLDRLRPALVVAPPAD